MPWTDDELARRIRAADPAAGVPDDWRASDDLALARIKRRIADEKSARQARRRAWTKRLIPAAVAASLVIVAVVVLPFGHAPHAAADGPPPLRFSEIDSTVDEVVHDARSRLAEDGSGVTVPLREALSLGWYAGYAPDGAEGPPVVVPEVREFRWSADGSGELRVTAGVPFVVEGTEHTPRPAPTPGTLLHEHTFEPGEFVPRDAAEPSNDSVLLRPMIAAFANGDATRGAGDQMMGIEGMLLTWTLPNAHHAAMLDIIAEDGDVEVLGETVDRTGEPAIGLHATSASSPNTDVILLISTETGRIVGIEQTYTGQGEALPVPTGTVLSYTAWEAP